MTCSGMQLAHKNHDWDLLQGRNTIPLKKKKKEMPLCKVPNDGEGQNKGEMSCFYFNPISLPPQPEKAVKEQTHHLL